MELDYGIVIYVINQSILKVNHNIKNPNLLNIKKNLVSVFKN